MVQCAAMLDEDTRCPERAIDGTVCREHLAWRRGRAGKLGWSLIVRDEEKVLERCLRSIRDTADEIVVTDTGSQDNTLSIAFQYADKVLMHPWQNSFSEARNFGLQFNTTDWVGWIDADESLLEDGAEELRCIVETDTKHQAIFCKLLSELPDERVSRHYLPKLFRRGTARFEKIVHNQLIHDHPALKTEIGIWHTGYNLPPEAMARKRKRTETLLRKQIAESPQEAFHWMNLARTLMTSGEYEESLEIAHKGLDAPETTSACQQMLYYNVAACSVNVKDFSTAKKALWQGLALNPRNLDHLFLLGWVFILEKEWAQAIVLFERYRQAKAQEDEQGGFNLLITDFYAAESQVITFLAQAYDKLGHHEHAASLLRREIQRQPNNTEMWRNLSVVYDHAQEREKLGRLLAAMIQRGLADDEIWRRAIEVGA